jgi:hypothetical protein
MTPTIPNDCPEKLRELMEMCWKKDPKQRPVSSSTLTLFFYFLICFFEVFEEISLFTSLKHFVDI